MDNNKDNMGLENLEDEVIDLDEVLGNAGQGSSFDHHMSEAEYNSSSSGHHSSSSSHHSGSESGRHSSSSHHSSESSHHSSESGRHSSSSHHSSESGHHSSSSSHHSSSGHRSSHSGGSTGRYARSKRLDRYMKHRKGSKLPGIMITVILAAIVVVFDMFLYASRMVSGKYFLPIVVALAVLVALVLLLTFNTAKRVRFVFGVIVAALTAAVLLYATVALGKVTNTLDSMTATTETEVSYVGVYVLTEDTAETLEDVADETFGIMEEVDRSVTDSALEHINEELGMEVATAEYAGPSILVGALYGQDCRCIVLNEAYIDVVVELDGYEDVEDNIRELARYEVTETVETEESSEEASADSDYVFTVFISGVDSRSGLVARSRSDVNILATVNKDTHQILLVSTPRDYYVPLSISNGQKDKLTHAGIYGVQVSMDTLAMLYDIDVDYYFRVSFEGFEDIVDALGGVTVYSDYEFSTGDYSFNVGYNYVDGAAALAFARERHAFADGDRQRGRNQMALISAIIDEAISPKILANYTSVLEAAEDNMEMSIPYDVLALLVSDQLDTGGYWQVISYSVTGTGDSAVPWSLSTSAYVMVPDESTVETASELMKAMINGEKISSPE
ncbi:MAG: LCP family protein [Clostridiales bacterium]|nr:LCP family protein [Clostridiales bacterium]